MTSLGKSSWTYRPKIFRSVECDLAISAVNLPYHILPWFHFPMCLIPVSHSPMLYTPTSHTTGDGYQETRSPHQVAGRNPGSESISSQHAWSSKTFQTLQGHQMSNCSWRQLQTLSHSAVVLCMINYITTQTAIFTDKLHQQIYMLRVQHSRIPLIFCFIKILILCITVLVIHDCDYYSIIEIKSTQTKME